MLECGRPVGRVRKFVEVLAAHEPGLRAVLRSVLETEDGDAGQARRRDAFGMNPIYATEPGGEKSLGRRFEAVIKFFREFQRLKVRAARGVGADQSRDAGLIDRVDLTVDEPDVAHGVCREPVALVERAHRSGRVEVKRRVVHDTPDARVLVRVEEKHGPRR